MTPAAVGGNMNAAGNSTSLQSSDATSLNNRGIQLDRQGNYAEAIAYFDKALAIDRNDKGALSNKANALYRLGNYTEAITFYDKALAIDRNFKHALGGKAAALFQLTHSLSNH